MKSKIDIDTRTFIRFWLVLFGIGIALALLYKAQTALVILGISFFLALALNGPVSFISKRLPGKSRVGATALAYVAVILFLGAVIFLVIPPIIQQTAQFAQRIPTLVDQATNQFSGLQTFVDQNGLQEQVDSALASIQERAGGFASNVGQSIVSGIGSFFSFITALILVLVLTFLMLIEGPAWMQRVWKLYKNPARMEKHRRVVGKMYNVVSGYVTGQLIVSTIGATAAGVFVFILSFIFPSVPAGLAMPTAAITFTLSLVPMFGATIGGVIVLLLLALNSIPATATYAFYFVIYQQFENNFISPKVQSKRINLSALMILAAVTIGLYMFGVAGGLIAIPVAGAIRILIDEYIENRKSVRENNLEQLADAKADKAEVSPKKVSKKA